MTTLNTNQSKRPWSMGEKALLWLILAVVALAGLGVVWTRRNAAPPSVYIPTPVMPARNAFDYFNAAANAEVQRRMMGYAEMGPPPPGATGVNTWPQLTLAQKAAVVQANAPLFRLLQQGLALPYQAPPIRSYMTPLTFTAPFREVARVVAVKEKVQIAQGRWGDAMSSGLDDVQYGEKMAHGSALIGLLVGVACEAIGRQPLWSVVDHLSAAQAEAAVRRLEAIDAERAPYAATVQEEKWSGEAGLLEILRRPNWRQALAQATMMNGSTGSGGSTFLSISTLFLSPSKVFQDYSDAMDKQLQVAKQPYTAQPASASVPSPGDPFVQLLAMDYEPAREKAAYTEAEDSLLTIMLALRAYDIGHHAYPTHLDALVPQYLSHVPNDPFAPSIPLHYKLTGKSYRLYSVGPDGKDDGGKPIFDPSQPAPRAGGRDPRTIVEPNSTGDIVAGVNL